MAQASTPAQQVQYKNTKRYVQWGVSQPNIEKHIASQINRHYLHDKHQHLYQDKRINENLGQELKQYKTEYSQVSAIETGFKKLKYNQIEILKELKKQYEVLRNSSLDNKVYYEQKVISSGSSVAESKSNSNSEALSSIKSKRSHTKLSERRQLKMVNVQKRQLEMMLNNSMKKIQELLHNQIELKKTILLLKNKEQNNKSSENQYDIAVKRSKQNEQSLKRSIEQLKRQNQTLKSKVKQLLGQNGHFSGSLNVKEIQLKKQDDKVRVLEQQVAFEKNKYFSLQLQIKRLQKEYDILERTKNEQILFSKKNKNFHDEMLLNEKQNNIKRLQDELMLKEERYILLLNKFNSIHSQRPSEPSNVPEAKTQKMYQQMLQIIRQERSKQSNSDHWGLLMQKISQMSNRSEDKLVNEIDSLKKQLQGIKSRGVREQKASRLVGESQLTRAQDKIRQLQKTIDEQNIQKMYFMEDVQKITRDFSRLKKEKENIEKEVKDTQFIIEKLQFQNKNYKQEIYNIKNNNIDLTESQHQNSTLIKKMQYYNLKEIELNHAKEQLARKIQEYRANEGQYQEQVRLLKRQLNEEEFKVFKISEESQLKIKLLKAQNESAISKRQQELESVKKAFALQKADLINQRIQWEKKHFLKSQQCQNLIRQLNNGSKNRQHLVGKKIEEYEVLLRQQREKKVIELSTMVTKVDSLGQTNQRLLKQSQKYMQIEQQLSQMKKIMRVNRRMTEGVDHLWSVKEVEYANINQILQTVKQ